MNSKKPEKEHVKSKARIKSGKEEADNRVIDKRREKKNIGKGSKRY